MRQVLDLAISSLLLGDSPYDLPDDGCPWNGQNTPRPRLGCCPSTNWLDGDPLSDVVPGAREGQNRLDGQLWRLPMLASMEACLTGARSDGGARPRNARRVGGSA